MKKVFSLLLVVAMLASLSLAAFAAPANEAGGMHTVITDNGATATIDVYVNNVVGCSGWTSYIVTEAVTYVDGSAVVSANCANGTLTPTVKSGYIKFALAFTDSADWFDAASDKVLSYTVNKVNPDAALTEDDFSYSTSTLKVSKVNTKTGGTVAGITAGNNFTTAKQPAYFTLEVDGGSDFDATIADDVITCIGKVDATVSNYGVEFTADSTVEGARAQKYYGAMPGDTVKDFNGSTTFTFGDWDGTFEIILEGVHAGTKTLNFFANDTIIADTTFTVVAE